MRLRDIFADVLKVSAVTPLVLSGCGANTAGYEPPMCASSSLAVSGLAPPVIPDVIELRHVNLNPSDNTPRSSPSVVSSAGTACQTATDKQACAAAFAALSPDTGFGDSCVQVCERYFLATTRGDEVKAWASLDELKAFLGTIDTPQEAALMVFANKYYLSCEMLDRGGVKARPGGGFDVIATRGFACGQGSQVTRFFLEVSQSGEVKETSQEVAEYGDPNCAIGRRPLGLVDRGPVDTEDPVGRHFASAAHLEAASVNAFLRLKDELALHGASPALRGAAVLSALEEVQHAAVTRRLAGRFGASAETPRVADLPLRSLFEVALDNAVEGCVRETFGALVAHHQAAHAADADIRAVLAGIADDETRHAELSWEIAAWAETQLSGAERATLRQAQRQAVDTLREELATPVDPRLVETAGLPDARTALAMLDTLAPQLWA